MFSCVFPVFTLCVCVVAQSCPTLCDPMNCSPLGSSVHGDSPGKKTGVSCHALLQGIFPTQGLNPGLPYCRLILYCLSHQGSPGDPCAVVIILVFKPQQHWVSPLVRNDQLFQLSIVNYGFICVFLLWFRDLGRQRCTYLSLCALYTMDEQIVLIDTNSINSLELDSCLEFWSIKTFLL